MIKGSEGIQEMETAECIFFLRCLNEDIPFQECLSENNIRANTYGGHTTTTLYRCLTYHDSGISASNRIS